MFLFSFKRCFNTASVANQKTNSASHEIEMNGNTEKRNPKETFFHDGLWLLLISNLKDEHYGVVVFFFTTFKRMTLPKPVSTLYV